ncbi:MAG: monovalent cation/H(+) antiporter subunit G [Defluviitaleaceae bacterium]|nr:monovalent cation/H(+) antiporter subunit G [Defluviitaleaceae bacterium]
MIEIISNVIISIGIFFLIIGVFGIYKFKDFYRRLLVSSKVDTVGAITILIGVIIRHGFSFFSAKTLLILALILILNPLTAHILLRTAYVSGHLLENEDNKKGD